jgi:hypothetical protein
MGFEPMTTVRPCRFSRQARAAQAHQTSLCDTLSAQVLALREGGLTLSRAGSACLPWLPGWCQTLGLHIPLLGYDSS